MIKELYDIYRAHPTVTTDSRSITEGCLFFALRGDNFDGNRFAEEAIAKGAAYAVVDDLSLKGISDRFFFVDNTLDALQKLASYHRDNLDIPIIAITGTNGKTTTKELLAAVLSRKYSTYATKGNLNNHIGVPLTMLSITPGISVGVVEMGASSKGEIAFLCEIAKPDFGLITNIGRAHLEGFGGEEGVLRAKGELYDFLAASGGTAIVREDDPTLHSMASARKELNIKYYDSLFADGFGSQLSGDYNRLNIAAAVAVGRIFDVPEEDIKRAIAEYAPTNNRSQRIDTGKNIVIADCYNANPSSMRAAIENLSGMSDGKARKRVLILGDMFELGEWSDSEHKDIAELALNGNASEVFFVGDNFARASAVLPSKAPRQMLFGDSKALASFLKENPISDALILVKGSRAIGLEIILPEL